MDPLTSVSTRTTPQHSPADERQVPNSAGGYGFAVTDDVRVARFLTLGTEGGTYYSSAADLTADNAQVVLRAARERGSWLVAQAVAVSSAGRAPRQNPAIFALAAAAALADDDGRRAALDALGAVCRTGTHLFLFAQYVEQFRGWGRGLRRAVGRWYTERPVDDVAFQSVKYRQRVGWSHRDLLRLAHPATTEQARRDLFAWIVSGALGPDVPPLVSAFVAAQEATTAAEWVRLVGEHPLSWEMLPDAALVEPDVWAALVDKGLPQTALMRQLPRLTRLGVLDDRARRAAVAAQLADPGRLLKARVHPVNVLVAQRTYALGMSVRGSSTWNPVREVVDALDAAFYAAFDVVEPAGKRTLLALDVSGSMGWSAAGQGATCREVSAALALVTMRTEPATEVVGFTTELAPLAISPRQRIDDVIRSISRLEFGGTDCAQPMLWAEATGREFDTFVVYTDNETWAGDIHPHQALQRYRQRTGIDARLVVAALSSTGFSIADPDDAGMLDVAGFDAAVPQLVADFSAGRV
ncbi:TROVE domain-containing protein [Pseudonocardia sp. CA-107938]|uniref:TROVE domain-containing protein n=1 Tax=Pseudonocardia sp. CA-107938 TaxID=3240021 RepID=UPI003D93275D